MDRRSATMLIGMAAIAPRSFAAAAAGPKPAPHDKRAAKAEFAKIIAFFSQGDQSALLAYGPLAIVVDKKKLEGSEIPKFLEQMTGHNDRKDKAPIAIDSFERMEKVVTRVVYHATLKRSAYFPEHCEIDDFCRSEGHSVMYEHWRVYFDGPRIIMLEQLFVLA